MNKRCGFTLVEVLVVTVVIAILAALLLPALQAAKVANSRAISAHSLKQLIAAGQSYLGEHENVFWKYREDSADGTMYWFGWESAQSRSKPEGKRSLDLMKGPLGPYAIAAGGVKTDPAFLAFSQRLKPKFQNGNYGYGYNTVLADYNPTKATTPRNALHVEQPAATVVFATCAQVNTFQAPATAKKPLLEEFYMINEAEVSVHFRHGNKALAAFLDGSVRELPMDPSSLDRRMSAANVGRFAPKGSFAYLGFPCYSWQLE